MNETWLPVSGFENYKISNYGGIKSYKRLKLQKMSTGYLFITLYRNGVRYPKPISHLVLETFVGTKPFPWYEACHNDGNKINNYVLNLRWADHSSNILDKHKHGTDHQLNKTHCPNGHAYTGYNLLPKANGGRQCRSCTKAHSQANYYMRKHKITVDVISLADGYYERMMNGS